MKTADQVFAKEFKDMMNGRRSMSGSFNLVDIPIPNMSSLLTNLGKGEVCLVKGLSEDFFDKLNNSEVQILTSQILMKRQVLSDGTFRVDSNGNYVFTQVPLKQGFVAIHSKKSIGLKRKVVINGIEKEHKLAEGFRYIDYFELKGERRYIYTIPKENVYPLNLCALIITPNKHRHFYKGCKLALQNGNYLYIYVIPFKNGRETRGYRVIGTKASPYFDIEVNKLLSHWMQLGIIFDLNMTALENQVGGENNLGIMDLVGTLGIDDYIRTNYSLDYETQLVNK